MESPASAARRFAPVFVSTSPRTHTFVEEEGHAAMRKTDPHLQAAFMEIVDNQIQDNEPPETRETLHRLQSQGFSEQDAKRYIGQAVCVEVWNILKHQRTFNRERYLRNLKNLPQEPQE